ncbi:MAG TPA: ABC transporter substrate-binding protein [Bryobacteraceae bacterium]|nr:ABC transporter substrate-binding protein [Bryobacteraceae bacterium]
MRLRIALMALACAMTTFGQYKPDPKLEPWIVLSDPEVDKILKAIGSLTPYQTPDLPLKIDTNYAATPEDVEPYGGVKPYKRHFLTQMEYTGPGRAIPEPGPELKAVQLGFLGPIMSTVSVATGGKSHEEALGIDMLRGARLAVEEANARGGYLKRKIPFKLVTRNDNGLWGASGNEIIRMSYQDPVWAMLGTIDGANSHIAIRVALKSEVVMMNSGDTDPTFIETNIPWVMRCIGDDRQMGYLLIDYMIRKMDHKRIGIIRSSNRYGRFGVREVRDGARRLKRPVLIEMPYKVGATDFTVQLERLQAAKLDAVVHWGDAAEGALILNRMREMGMTQPFYACDRTVSDEFVQAAGANAEGVIAGYPWNPDRQDPKYLAFKERYRQRFGKEPETYAAHGYDGMNMLIRATQFAGLNRAKIRDLLAYQTRAFPGVTGDIQLGAALDDIGEVFLARFEGGRWKYYSRESLQVPKANIPRRTPEGLGLSKPGSK